MSQTPPDHRYLDTLHRVRRGRSVNDDGLVGALGRALRGEDDVPDEVAYAYYMYQSPYHREVLDAFLLVKTTDDEIKAVLEIDKPVVDVYRHLFFDVNVFRNRLDREAYARSYEGDDDGYGRELKTKAMERGRHWLVTRWGMGVGHHANQYEAVKETITLGYLQSKAALDHALDSAKAKEARMWAGTMTNSINTLQEAAETGSGKDRDVLIKLRLLDYSQDPEDRELPEVSPEDIVHVPEDDS